MTKIYRSIDPSPWEYGYGPEPQTEEAQKKELAKFEEARKLFVAFRKNFEKWYRYQVLPKSTPEEATWLQKEAFEKAWAAESALGSLFPDRWDFRTKKHLPSPWALKAERERNIKRYQVKMNEALKAIEEFLQSDRSQKGVRPELEQIQIEGFPVILRGWNVLDSSDAKKSIGIIRDGLNLYKENASKRLPLLLKYKLPFHAAWECHADQAATYNRAGNGRIKLCMSWPTAGRTDIKRMAHVIAHEMGHHIWQKVLSGKAQKFWEAAIDADWAPLDLRKLLRIWPEDVKFSSSLASRLAEKDPTLSLQIEVANSPYGGKGTSFSTREDAEHLVEQGKTVLSLKNPITEYATKNNEEAFCEAVGSLVGYGPRTLHPLTRRWLQTILPGMRLGSTRISEMLRSSLTISPIR